MEEMTELLRELAAELGTTVEFLWAVLIRQAKIEIVEIGILAAFVGVGWFLMSEYLRWAIPFYKNLDGYDNIEKELMLWTIGVIIGVVLVVLTIIVTLSIANLPTLIFNPEYWALRQILNHIR